MSKEKITVDSLFGDDEPVQATTTKQEPSKKSEGKEETPSRQRPRHKATKTVYEAKRGSHIPQELKDDFAKDGWHLRMCRWFLGGEEDFRYLATRENTGYEFVKVSELPEWYLKSVKIRNLADHQGVVTIGDMVLMKCSLELAESRRAYYEEKTEELASSMDTLRATKDLGHSQMQPSRKVINRQVDFK
jgi:hypothetical protein